MTAAEANAYHRGKNAALIVARGERCPCPYRVARLRQFWQKGFAEQAPAGPLTPEQEANRERTRQAIEAWLDRTR
jgi:hypothetical protein